MAKALGFKDIDPNQSLQAQLAVFAPAALATSPHPIVSEKYQFVNTMDVIDQATKYGWEVRQAGQRLMKNASLSQYGPHMVKLEHPDYRLANGDKMEMLIRNAHNRMARYRIDAGYFRLICTNDMVIKIHDMFQANETHKHTSIEWITGAIESAMKGIENIGPQIQVMEQRVMTKDEQYAFALSALALRHEEEKVLKLPKAAINDFLNPLRGGDRGDTLWKVFNVTQEKLITGSYMFHNPNGDKLRKQQRVTSAEADYGINAGLSEIALQYIQ